MKIESMNLFHTPEDWGELAAWIERHIPEERPHLLTAACMAWNLAVKISEMSEDEVEVMRSRLAEKGKTLFGTEEKRG